MAVVAVVSTGLLQTAEVEPADFANEDMWGYWRPRMQAMYDASPTGTHRVLRALVDQGKVDAVITDTEDVLLEESGIEAVELTPSVAQSFCLDCGYTEPLGCLLDMDQVPLCAACGAVLTPGPLTPPDPLAEPAARELLSAAHLVIVIGAISPRLERLVGEYAVGRARVDCVSQEDLRRLAGG